MILSDLGARVVKVEPPAGDPLRHSNATMFASMNRGKESIALDLKADDDRQTLHAMVRNADVVLEGSRPGVADRLAADYDTLLTINPRIVYCSISGYGQDGPWRERPAHDLNYLAHSGYLGLQSAVEGRPWPPAILISDLASGLYATIAVLAAVNGRGINGEGTYIDLSMTESVVSLLGLEIAGAAIDNHVPEQPNMTFIPTYALFACADGRWLSLGIVHEDHFWRRLCDVAGLTSLADMDFDARLESATAVKAALEETLAAKPADEWEQLLVDVDVPAAAVQDLAGIFDSPQFRARGTFLDIGIHRFVTQPFKLSTGTVEPTSGPPALDEHRSVVIADLVS